MSHTETERSADLIRRRRELLVGLVGRQRRVLLVEPAEESLAAELEAQGCEVAAGSVDRDGLGHPSQTFDVVALPEVLSTYADPHALLKSAVEALGDDGRVVALVPNAAHAARRLALLVGDWTESLGDTHSSARQLTKRSLCELLESAGLVVEELHGVVVDPLETDVPVHADGLPDAVVEWVRHQPDALHESFVAVIRPRAADEDVAEPPRVHGDRPLAEARLVDEHTERARALAEADHRRLTTRDTIIGLEATTRLAEWRRDLALAATKDWKGRTRRWRTAYEELAAEVVRLADERKPAEALRALAERSRGGLAKSARDAADDS